MYARTASALAALPAARQILTGQPQAAFVAAEEADVDAYPDSPGSAAGQITAPAPDPAHLVIIPVAQLTPSPANLRTNPDANLEGLTASLATMTEPYLAQAPVVALGPGGYQVISGARRILAARAAGWQRVACHLRAGLDAKQVHTIRLVENLHRQELDPLDLAVGLRISRAVDNLSALGLGTDVLAILDIECAPAEHLARLEELLHSLESSPDEDRRFKPNHPPVAWEAVLAKVGLSMNKPELKRLVRLANIVPDLHDRVRALRLTRPQMASLGRLEPADQRRLVAEIEKTPALGRRLQRIARTIGEGGDRLYNSLDQALAEQRGEVYLEPGGLAAAPGDGLADVTVDAVEALYTGDTVDLTDLEEPDELEGDAAGAGYARIAAHLAAHVGPGAPSRGGRTGYSPTAGADAQRSLLQAGGSAAAADSAGAADVTGQAVLRLLQKAGEFTRWLDTVTEPLARVQAQLDALGLEDVQDLPAPWGEYAAQTIGYTLQAIADTQQQLLALMPAWVPDADDAGAEGEEELDEGDDGAGGDAELAAVNPTAWAR